MMRLVLDTVVLVAAFRSDSGASRQLLLAVLDGAIRPLVSVPLMIEYEAVLTRPEHLAAAAVTAQDVGVVLDTLAELIEPVRLEFLWRPLLPDADDDMVMETAVNGRADAIVTFNRKDFEPAGGRFGIEVTSPADALKRMNLR
jgi:putative PIN family toxin of toxin-antitoxin system